ncbi:MAG: efflux RND transporter periplasmic adaptor subunit [Candidatus Symbiothrix sp.]|jgi:RND family efflux transporter MFP subunit|nr:efflux RND transporter periplasmic adaptor subunit [Candidatus Symbiothrix sp.]
MEKIKYFIYSAMLLAIAGLPGCGGRSDEAPKAAKIIPVKVISLEPSSTTTGRNYVGTVEASVVVSLAFSSMGTVEQVYVSEGQRVKKGQLLAALNTATAENSYQMMLAKQQQAQDAYDRLVKVHANGSLPDIKFVEVETGLQQAKSAVAIAKKNLDDCRLYAPRDGVITNRSVEAGSNAIPGAKAFQLVSVDRVNVKIAVPENEIGKITEGQTAIVVTPALDNAVFTGKIEMKGVSANAISHTYEAKIGIDNLVEVKNVSPLLPGMVCKVFLAGDAGIVEIVVPNRTIQIAADGRKYVWLADGDVARRQFVETGELHDNGIVIVDGLSAGDRLIAEGFQKVSEGMKIKIDASN